MKKLIVFLAFLVLLVGCGKKQEEVTSSANLEHVIKSIQEQQELNLKETIVLNKDQVVQVFGLSADSIEDASGLQASITSSLSDVLIIRTKDASKNKEVKQQLDVYYQQLFLYPSQTVLLENKIVEEKNNLIYVIVAENASTIKEYVEKGLK